MIDWFDKVSPSPMAMTPRPRRAGALVFPAFLCASAIAAQAPATPATSGVERAVATITAEDLGAHIGVIAHDSMRGRGTPSPELNETAEWIAAEFQRSGLSPGGDDGTFVQRYPIRRVALDPTRSGGRFGRRDLRYGTDMGPALAIIPPATSLTGPLVVVSGTTGIDSGLGSATFTGKHVLIVPGFGEDQRTPEVRALMRAVLGRDPLAVWLANDDENLPWATRINTELRREHSLVGDPPPPLAALMVRDRSIAPSLRDADLDLAALRERVGRPVVVHDAARVLVGVTTEWYVLSDRFGPNTVGILEGSDPLLRDEYLVFSAHMDHVGVGTPDLQGDSIYNGADDDASGTATVVELAEAFATLEPRPRRSIIFVAVSGEEHGRWGSAYFVEHSLVPIERMVANVNVDMVGRNWTDTIVAIGKEHSDLGQTLARVNAAHPELSMTAVDDLWPAESFYTRSDHYSFARRGVPILFFFNGTHEDYHKPSDEPEKIDAEKAARIGRLLFYLGLEVANRPERPRWNPESYRAIVRRSER